MKNILPALLLAIMVFFLTAWVVSFKLADPNFCPRVADQHQRELTGCNK